MRQIDTIVVHCADTPPSMDIGAAEIRQWHKDRGWSDIGYHYVIRRSGVVETGRDLDGDGDILEEVGAHVLGHNATSIGVCLVGGAHGDFNFRLCQLIALRDLVRDLKARLGCNVRVVGHRDLDDRKACPNFSVEDLLG